MTQIIDACFFNDLNMYCLNKMGDMGMYQNQENYDDYNFLVNFIATPTDKVSKEQMQTTGLAAGRVSYHGGPYGINEPAVDKNGLFGCPVIENLIDNPEDTSQWSGSGPWTNTVTVGTGTHTLSTDIDGAMVSIAAGTATIDGVASATYGNPANFEVTGAGTITIQTDTADPKAQITATEYKLPYVNGLSPENFSDADQGYKFDNEGQLLDALDGVADGSELIGTFDVSSLGAGWIDHGDDVYSCDGSQTTTSTLTFGNSILDAGEKYQILFEVIDCSDGSVRPNIGGSGLGTYVSSTGTYTQRIVQAGTFLGISFTASPSFIGTIYLVSLKQISPAQGKLTVKWRPMFNSGDLTGTVNIITANDEASSFLLFDADNDLLKLTDGTNTSQVACAPIVDTEYEVTAQHDETNGMVISLDGIAGTTVTFAGRFPKADDLSYLWEAGAPQYVKISSIEKESGL